MNQGPPKRPVTGESPAPEVTTPHEPFGECSACQGDECADLTCPQSQRPCGHHCNCVMVHDHCHWCGTEWGEEVEPDAVD